MTIPEKVELISIPIFGIGIWLVATLFTLELPSELNVGNLALMLSSLLLLQGLVRDLFILARAKRMSHTTENKVTRVARCMCMESTLGIIGILLGIGIFCIGINQSVQMANWAWGGWVMLTMSVGFAIKDLVIETNPWRIVRDKDHMNIVFKWK